jgi:sialate O-acetylesterase
MVRRHSVLASFAWPFLHTVAGAQQPGDGDVQLPAVLSDHAVFQRGKPLRIWGKVSALADVRVTTSWRHEASSRADDAGAFELVVQPADTAGPHELTVASANKSRVLRDLWFGDVWLCGGQSNMEWTLGPGVGPGIDHWEREVDGATDAQIRVFDVPNVTSPTPRADSGGSWVVCTPQAARSFSAVAYLFAREIRQHEKVPIGLLVSCWGGTPAEAWTPEAEMEKLGGFDKGLETMRAARGAPHELSLANKQANWFHALRSKDEGENNGFHLAALADSDWATVQVPGEWSGELAQWDGVVWYRRTLDIPKEWEGQELALSLGPVDDLDTVWFDGVNVGGLEAGNVATTARRYPIPSEAARAGVHHLVVRVVDIGGRGGFTGSAAQLWIGAGDDASRRQSLAGQWRLHKGAPLQKLGAWPRQEGLSPNLPSVLFQGMIAPLARLALRGVLFYQGESNASAPLVYRKLFPTLITAWRDTFGQPELPFYYVQIAPFGYGGDAGKRAAFLREAQTLAMEQVQHVGMAVTMDIGNPKDIHPGNKQDVAKRLALWALAKTYGKTEIEPSGPMLAGYSVEDGAMRLLFRNAKGLRSKEGGALTFFTIAGEDRVFHPAVATIEHGETVLVRSDKVDKPVAVRYAFGAADTPNLVNGQGLPAPSFRTDDWPPP